MAVIEILDPTGWVVMSSSQLAPRVHMLQGKVLGIIDNGMLASHDILQVLAELFREAGVSEVVLHRKPSVSHPANSAVVADFAKRCDFVICGVGV
jgi:hypothetical protein